MSIPKMQKTKKSNKITNNYVDNKRLYYEMKKYIEKRKIDSNTVIPNYVGECILLIANNLSNKSNFSGYTNNWKEEMISDGIENAIMYINNFDPERFNNPFAYFSMIIYNAFIRRINKEKKHQYIKYKNAQNHNLNEQLENNTFIPENNDVLNTFIDTYETTMEAKKQKLKGLDVIFDHEKDKTTPSHNTGLDS